MLELNKIHEGNCLEILKDIPDNSIDLIVRDPPYNKVQDTKFQSLSNILFKGFIKDLVSELSRVTKEGGSIYIIMDWREISYFYIAMVKEGLIPQNWITWKYTNGSGSTKRYSNRHDDILFFTNGDKFTFNTSSIRIKAKKNVAFKLKSGKMWNPPEPGKKNCDDTWVDINMVNSQAKIRCGHPTQKPVELMERMILASSNEGAVVLDCFMGSGTTAIACKNLKRNFIGIETNKEYIEMAEKRIATEVKNENI